MRPIPGHKYSDSTLALLRDPYGFISKRCQRYQSDLFQTRLMLRPTICMMGCRAAELFYDEARFTRRNAAPGWLQKTLFGKGGVQGLDGESHRHRKQMFMLLMAPERIAELGQIARDWWSVYLRRWSEADSVVLYREVNELLTRVVCAWAGVPLAEADVRPRTQELVAMFDRAAAFGCGHVWARLARRRAERWIGNLIDDVRQGRLKTSESSAAYVIVSYRGLNGKLLDRKTAAVELINVLRPTVAVSVFITFCGPGAAQISRLRDSSCGPRARI